MIRVTAPARICLFGDHQDYLGLPVIAASIDRYLTLEAVAHDEKTFVFELKDLHQTRQLPLIIEEANVKVGDFLASSLVVLARKGILPDRGYHISIQSNIPVNAGISSSSALIIAWMRFLIQTFGSENIDTQQLADWANEAEVEFFGDPGGLMDHYSIALEDLRMIYPSSKTTALLSRPSDLPLILVESGIAKETVGVLSLAKKHALEALKRVQQVAPELNYHNAQPEDIKRFESLLPPELFVYWEAAIANYHITQAALKLMQGNDKDQSRAELAALIAQHQYYLETAIQNTPDAMKAQMQVALAAGGEAVKVIGSGGGGCFFVVSSKEAQPQIIKELLASGAAAAYPIHFTP
jgi:galactokinase